ncbi:hypothetical protein PanWU01x14_177870 [Parasponia andersonii]|uniref:Uncharacterized protein n=1 Tax=Parasponia andersonii TaxID=3476 RepID=A0A2P5C7E0_PARAD|nr:hypothetical protein PanWU01x14_177870 [Parasponia andersonii]
MASPSPADSSAQEAAIRKQNKGAPIKFLVPLVYAPVLPLIRIALRKNPVVRDRLFTAVLAGAFAHGFYLGYISSSIRGKSIGWGIEFWSVSLKLKTRFFLYMEMAIAETFWKFTSLNPEQRASKLFLSSDWDIGLLLTSQMTFTDLRVLHEADTL